MEFHQRLHPFSGHELAELVAISPDDAAMQQGFNLQDPEVDDVVRTAKDLEAGYIEPDTSLTAEENVELLLRTTRLLQLGLEVQYVESQSVLAENNTLRGDLRELEDQNRQLEAEVGELRELRDQEALSGDVKELELELKELRHALDEERKANDQLIMQTDLDRGKIDDLEGRLQRGDDVIKRKDDELADQKEQLSRLRDDFDELRGQYAALTQQGHGREQQREMSETIRQQEWKIERLTKDNRALEASNCELRAQLEALKEENLQVSEKILLLDAEAKELRLAAAAADDRAEVLAREKVQVMGLAEELRADVAAKMALLDEFEARFARQYRSWDEERTSLVSQIEALRKEARLYVASNKGAAGGLTGDGSGRSANGPGGADGEDAEESPAAKLAALKRSLDEAKENEVLLLEAYEQLEADVGQEVDRALARQAEEVARLTRRVQFLEGHLDTEKKQVEVLGEEVTRLEGQLGDATARMTQYESGVYGLPQAALEIRQLKETVAGGEGRVKELVQQVNKLSAALEDLSDESVLLRRKAGLPADQPLDTAGVKLQKDITIAQLRSVNALLERQVSDLEEERRKLRLEVKFRAKYHGKTALEMGLSPEQLLLLEEYVDGLKGGRNPEERLVTQLQQRIEFLEVRLAEVMAYADIPINMRPVLTELSSGGMSALAVAAAGTTSAGQQHQQHLFLAGLSAQAEGSDSLGRGGGAAAGVAGGIKATQVELVRGALLGCLKMLRQMSEALAEHRQITDTEYKQFTDTIIDKLIDAERVTSLVLKDLSAAAAAAAVSGSAALAAATAATTPTADEQQAAARRYGRGYAVVDDNFIADAAAEELRERLQQLAKQVVELQVSLAQKDALLSQLAQHKAAMEARLGLTGNAGGDAAAVAAAAVAARRGGDYVAREQHEQLEVELATVKEQLIECLEELNSRELELTEMSSACRRYQADMAEMSDQVRLLYREHSSNTATWQRKCSDAEKQLNKARAEAADATTQRDALDQALTTLEAGDMDAVKHQYVAAVRKMAVTQLKHAKLARQLEASTAAEKAASERVQELQEELLDCSSTCRSRMHWLEQAAADAARRTQQLYRCLQNAAPLEAYQTLVAKHSQLAQEHRKLLEQWGDAAVGDQVEELLAVRQQLADLIPRYDAACDMVAELREKLRQLELPATLASRANPAFATPSSRPQLAAAAATVSQPLLAAAPGSVSGVVVAASSEVQLQLNEELVAATVKLDNASRRLEVLEREKQRLNNSLQEAQALTSDLEQRLASVSAELCSSRALEARLQQRLAASVPTAQLDEMAARLQVAEAAAAQEDSKLAALTLKAEEAERRLAELGGKRQKQLADITNLRATVRELSSTSDEAAKYGKLAAELDHVRAKESLARSALNRSEMERVELERQARGLKQQVASLGAQLSLAQDQARWAESELLDTLMRLEIGLAGRVEAWKANRWAAKLEQLKTRNDGLAQALESAVKRFSKLEDAAHEAQLSTEAHTDIAALLSRGASEAHREVAALKQQQMALKLEAGRLTRAELLMRQKVGYLESVNAELCEQLERCDAEALSQQGGLQAEKAELATRIRQLQEEVVRLQDRTSGYLAELDELKTAKSSRSLLATAGGETVSAAAATTAVPGGAAAGAAHMAKTAQADKELMLKQIDSLKEARTEAEHMRLEVRRLESGLERKEGQLLELQAAYDDVLERLKGQSSELLAALGASPGCVALSSTDETALSQLRAIAEAAMRELQAKVQEREGQIAALTAKLQEHQAAYLEQHARDRAEIEALSNKLFESGAASIAGLKANLAKATAALAATGDGGEELPYEQLRLLLEQRSSEVEVLRNRLEQREASLEAMRKNYEAQAHRQEAEVERLAAALAAAPKEDVSRPGSKAALQRLTSEVKAKDVKLKQLRGAIKALEDKLAQLLKDKVDIVMQASSWVEQEQLDERLTEMEAHKAQLAADLHATQAELAACRKSLAMQEGAARKLSDQLLKEGEAVAALKTELSKEQALVNSLRDKLSKAHAGTSSSGSSTQEESLQQHQQIAVLNKRIATLDRENQHLQAEVSRLAAFTTALQASSAGAQNAPAAPTKPHAPAETSAEAEQQKQQGAESGSSGSRAGLALLKPGPHRLAGTLKSVGSVGMPETPTDAASTGGGGGRLGGRRGRGAAAGRGFSSDGGGSVAGSSTLAGAHDPAGQAGREDMQASQSQAAAAASAAGGVTYATQHWEETKQLQGKVDALRRKLVKKSEECDALLKECERRNALIAGLTSDRDQAAAAAAAAQAKLRRHVSQEAAAGPPLPSVDASKLKDYVEQVLQLQADKDQLLMQLELLKHQQEQQQQQPRTDASSSSSNSIAVEQQLFELRLQKEQAVAAAARLKQQLAELFPAATAGAAGGDSSLLDPGQAGRPGSAAGAGSSSSSLRRGSSGSASGSGSGGGVRWSAGAAGNKASGGREAELLATITNLKAALEKAMACSTPNTRHVQEVQQRKSAQKQIDRLRAELDQLKPQLTAANEKVAELQATNAALRVSVNDLKQRLLLATDNAPTLAAAGSEQQQQQQQQIQQQQDDSSSQHELGRMKQVLAQRDAELARLQQQQQAATAGGPDTSQQQQLVALRQHAAVLQQENEELRQELAAFDPAFFEELEDLKHSHHQLQQKATAQAKLIRQLQSQLVNSSSSSSTARASGHGAGAEGGAGGVGGRSSRVTLPR